MFPFMIEGFIATRPWTRTELDLLAHRLGDELHGRGIVAEIKHGEVSFLNRSPSANFLPWALFRGVDRGKFGVQETSIHYRLDSAVGLVLPLSMLGLLLLTGLFAGSVPIVMLGIFWLLATVTHYLFTVARVRRLLRRLAERLGPAS